jgi:hypothetical protein
MIKNFLVAEKYIKNECTFIFYVQRLSYDPRDIAQDNYLKETENRSCRLRRKNNHSTQKHRICKLQTALNFFSHQG